MTQREGSLEAPTRHPLDWKSAAFYDEDALYEELERVYDICHGCHGWKLRVEGKPDKPFVDEFDGDNSRLLDSFCRADTASATAC